MFSSGGAWPIDPQVAAKTGFVPQGISADLIATKWGFSRRDVDAYAVESPRRAKQAWDAGHFAKSIVPVQDLNGLIPEPAGWTIEAGLGINDQGVIVAMGRNVFGRVHALLLVPVKGQRT